MYEKQTELRPPKILEFSEHPDSFSLQISTQSDRNRRKFSSADISQILVVEDSALSQEVLSNYLDDLGLSN